jgi:hypothetical protein
MWEKSKCSYKLPETLSSYGLENLGHLASESEFSGAPGKNALKTIKMGTLLGKSRNTGSTNSRAFSM